MSVTARQGEPKARPGARVVYQKQISDLLFVFDNLDAGLS